MKYPEYLEKLTEAPAPGPGRRAIPSRLDSVARLNVALNPFAVARRGPDPHIPAAAALQLRHIRFRVMVERRAYWSEKAAGGPDGR